MVVGSGNELEETEAVLQQLMTIYSSPEDIAMAAKLAQQRREMMVIYDQKQRSLKENLAGMIRWNECR
jgi:hypothetical protein